MPLAIAPMKDTTTQMIRSEQTTLAVSVKQAPRAS